MFIFYALLPCVCFPFLCWIKFCSGCIRLIFFILETKKVVTVRNRQVVVLYSNYFMGMGLLSIGEWSSYIVGPPTPLLNGGQDLPKIESLGEVYKIFCQKGGINLKRGGDAEMGGGGLPLFYYFTVQSHLLCVGKVRLPLLLFGSSVF